MKRVKLMLLSFCILAVVAGALAFKAKGTLDFCTAPTKSINPTLACPSNYACPTENTKLLANDGAFICTAATSGFAATPCKVNGNPSGATILCGTTSAQ